MREGDEGGRGEVEREAEMGRRGRKEEREGVTQSDKR